MSYDQLASSVDTLATANTLLTDQVIKTQVSSNAAVAAAETQAVKAQRAADAAQLSASVYLNTTIGLANTPLDKFFSVVGSDSIDYLILYQNSSGAAVEQGRYPSVYGVSQSTPNLWPDPFFSDYYAKYGSVSVIPGRMSGEGVLNANNQSNPYKSVSVDIPAGSGIRTTAFFVPFTELGTFKQGDRITAKVVVVTNGPARFDVATRESINGPAIQSTLDRKTGSGVVELSASLTLNSALGGLFLRVQLDETNTGTAIVAAMIAGKGVGLGYSERAVNSTETKQLAHEVVVDYKVPVLGTDFFRVGKNLFNPATRVDGSYINVNDFVIANAAYAYSDYMPVKPMLTYTGNTSLRFILFYDKTKTFLGSSTTLQSVSQFVTPQSAEFIRVSVAIEMNTTLQIEQGSVSTSFEAYGYYMKGTDSYGTPIKVITDVPVTQTRPNVYGYEYLRETHQRLRSITLGDNVRFNIGCIGDSWTHNSLRWINPVFTTLAAKYGGLGDGWIGFAFAQAGQTNGSVRGFNVAALAGTWTTAYATGSGPDAGSVTSSVAGATASATLSTYTAERNIYLLALGGSGSITYKVGAASAVTVDLSTMTGVQKINMGLITGSAAVVITVVSGSVTLFGMIESLTGKGVGVHKLGSTGSRASQWAALDPVKFKASLAALELNLSIIMLGTNDQAQPATKAAFKASIEVMIVNIRAACPTADILLIAPCENMRGLPTPIKDYADAMYELAVKYQCAFVDLQPNFGEKPADYSSTSQRPWFLPDDIHPDPATGGRAIVSAVLKPITD